MGKIEKLTNGTTGGPVFVYVQDGKILRITPMEFDDNFATEEEMNALEDAMDKLEIGISEATEFKKKVDMAKTVFALADFI